MKSKKPVTFTQEQQEKLRKSAIALLCCLEASPLPEASQLLDGGLREILLEIENAEEIAPLEEVPFFTLMTRDYLPEKETKLYLDFYSLAQYGVPAEV